ncbi:MAG: MazG family protein [Rickettsiales bacterium]|nr:MazG family protein [Rickettsiales bacterium]
MKNTTQLLEIMAQLRDKEKGCPWDIEQDFVSIAPHTLEEAYEVADAIARGDMQALKEELGDLLFQVVFLSRIAEESGLFDFEAVAASMSEKLIRRHPHIFADATMVRTADEQTERWEAIKAEERKGKSEESGKAQSVLDDVPFNLPALLRASKLQKRASRVGFDWEKTEHILDKIEEEIQELRVEMAGNQPKNIEEELGDVLFSCVNLANRIGSNAESALRSTNAKFERRFRYIEQSIATQGGTLETSSLEAMDALWNEAKRLEKS